MTSQRAGQTPLKSRWSDSTLSTAATTPISPTQSRRHPAPDSRRVAPPPPSTPVDENPSASHVAPATAAPRPADPPTGALSKSTTSASQRSGEITIMLDADIPDLPRARSADLPSSNSPATAPRAPLRVNAPPVLRLPEDAGEPSPKGLKSRYFRADRSASIALNSPSSLIPSPMTPRGSQASSAKSATRVRSELGPPKSNASSAAAISQDLRPSSHIPVSASATLPASGPPRDRAESNPSFAQFLQTAPPASLHPAFANHSRSQSASSAAASSLPISAMSSISRRDRGQPESSELMPPSQAFHTRHARHQSSVSSMTDSSRVTKKRLNSALPPLHSLGQDELRESPKPASRASVQSKKSTAESILGRLGTISRFGRADPSRYQKLDEGQERQIPLEDLSRPEQDEPEEALGIDISSLEGPTRHSPDDSRTHPALRRNQTMHRRTSEDDILEAKGHLTGGLGIGMTEVVTKTLQYPDHPVGSSAITKSPILRKMTLKRQPSDKVFGQTRVGQQTAEYEGTVIAVEEEVGVDISNAEGTQLSKAPRELDDFIADSDPKQSYYFPPDPQMPDWRPFTMRPWYLIILIVLAIAFAATIEALVQISQRRADQPIPTGLLTFKNADDVSTSEWFVWKYMPEGVFVVYGVLFQATDFEVRRLEPYWQMAQIGGAKAEESLNLDYLTFMSYLIPFKAFRHRQWAVMQSSLATILSSALIPVLFSAALDVDPDRDERRPDKEKYVRMNPAWSRVLEVSLLLVAILGTLLLIQLRRKSGLQDNPKGIAGICAMATKSHILQDFRALDIANHNVIHKQLAHRRYILHKSSLWQGEYRSTAADDIAPKNADNPHPMALHLRFGIGFFAFLAFFLVFIPIVEFNAQVNIVTEKAPWFLTLLATFIKLAWANLETGVRMLQPFYVLSRRHAPPGILLLDYTGTVPGYMPIKASLNKHFLLAAVGAGSILCEVLTVVVSSFNIDGWLAIDGREGSGAETRTSYLSSFSLAIAIPVILVVILGVVYLRRRHAFLPRQPATIASVLAFVAQSKMLYDFVAPDDDFDDDVPAASGRPQTNFDALRARLAARRARRPDVAQRTVALYEARGKRFGLGWYRGRDGTDHLGVDEEELLADYNHGIDWSKGRMGPHDIGAWERF